MSHDDKTRTAGHTRMNDQIGSSVVASQESTHPSKRDGKSRVHAASLILWTGKEDYQTSSFHPFSRYLFPPAALKYGEELETKARGVVSSANAGDQAAHVREVKGAGIDRGGSPGDSSAAEATKYLMGSKQEKANTFTGGK